MPTDAVTETTDTASALRHVERLLDIWLPQVLAEGITDPGAALARVVDLDTARVSEAIGDLRAMESLHGRPTSYRAARGQAMVECIARRAYDEARAAAEPAVYSDRWLACAAERGCRPDALSNVDFLVWAGGAL